MVTMEEAENKVKEYVISHVKEADPATITMSSSLKNLGTLLIYEITGKITDKFQLGKIRLGKKTYNFVVKVAVDGEHAGQIMEQHIQ